MNKNELLLLADEHFSGFTVDLAEDPEDSKVHSEMGQDITEEYFSFVRMLLRLNGISASHLASATRPATEPHDPEL